MNAFRTVDFQTIGRYAEQKKRLTLMALDGRADAKAYFCTLRLSRIPENYLYLVGKRPVPFFGCTRVLHTLEL